MELNVVLGFLFFLEVVTTPDTLTGKKERKKKTTVNFLKVPIPRFCLVFLKY